MKGVGGRPTPSRRADQLPAAASAARARTCSASRRVPWEHEMRVELDKRDDSPPRWSYMQEWHRVDDALADYLARRPREPERPARHPEPWLPGCRVGAGLRCRVAGLECRVAGLPGCRVAGLPGGAGWLPGCEDVCPGAGLPGCRVAGLPGGCRVGWGEAGVRLG